MVGSYWRRVASRAWRRGLEMVRVESFERIIKFLIGLLIPAAAVWYLVGDQAGAAVRFLASLAGSAIAALIVFSWGLMKLPAEMEAEAEQERLRIAAQLQSEDHKRRRREAPGELLASAISIAQAYTTAEYELDVIIESADEWGKRARELADTYLDGADRALFWSDIGILMGEPSLSEDRKGRWRWMSYRAYRLQQIISSL